MVQKYNTNPSFADLKEAFDNFYNNAISSEENARKAGYASVFGAKKARTYDLNHKGKVPVNPETFMYNPRKYDWPDVDLGDRISKIKGNPQALAKARAARQANLKLKKASTTSGTATAAIAPKKTIKLNKKLTIKKRDQKQNIYLDSYVYEDEQGKYIVFYVPDGTSGVNYVTWDTYINPEYEEDIITPEYLDSFFDEIIEADTPITNVHSISFGAPDPSLSIVELDKVPNVTNFLNYVNANYTVTD